MGRDSYLGHHLYQQRALRLEAALDDLCSPRARERMGAVQTLIEAGSPAVPGLLNALDHADIGVREAAARALQGIGRPAVKPLAARLMSHKAHVREAAAAALKNIGDRDSALALRDLLYRELEDNRYKYRRWRFWRMARIAACGGVFVWWMCHYHENPIFIFYPLVAGLTASFADTGTCIRRDAVAALSRQDACMIGPLAICLSDNDDAIRCMAAEALQRLLPQVQSSDRRYVSPPEMEALLRALGGKDDHLIVAILMALAQVGDAHAMPLVESLILHGRTMEVRRAARDCLPFLRLRAAEAQQARTLLRAAHVEAVVSSNILLRPAAPTEHVAPEQLLRSIG
jgi:HEAT repeat protein